MQQYSDLPQSILPSNGDREIPPISDMPELTHSRSASSRSGSDQGSHQSDTVGLETWQRGLIDNHLSTYLEITDQFWQIMEGTFRDELTQTVLLEFRVRGEPQYQYLALVCAEMLRMGGAPSPIASAIGTGPPSDRSEQVNRKTTERFGS